MCGECRPHTLRTHECSTCVRTSMAKPLASTFALNRYLGTEYLPRAVGPMELWQAAWLHAVSASLWCARGAWSSRFQKSNVSLRRLDLRKAMMTVTTQQEQKTFCCSWFLSPQQNWLACQPAIRICDLRHSRHQLGRSQWFYIKMGI